MLNKYYQILDESQYKLQEVIEVEVEHTNFRYVGDTLCEIDDPRLNYYRFSFDITKLKPNGKYGGYSSSGSVLTDIDPCI